MKKRNIFWVMLSVLMVLSLLLVSCEKEGTTQTDGITTGDGDWWDKFGEPEYGGKITHRVNQLNPSFDNYNFGGGEIQYWFEHLFARDWTLDRDIWSFKAMFVPEEYTVGLLAESWEKPDYQTIIVHLRQGAHWQDKPPVNGREFTADDVVYHYDRMLGTGSGFTEPSPIYAGMTSSWESVTAIDKYTVQVKFKQPSALGFLSFADQFALNTFEPREWVEQGDLDNWENAVGTGPWMLTDYIAGTNLTYARNPNYWGWDERHPENGVPYVDELSVVCIPDVSTAMAALRSGKIDVLSGLSWELAGTLEKSNPDLIKTDLPEFAPAVDFKCDAAPFNDLQVRKALQLALDRELIAKTYYGGTVEPVPCGLVCPDFTGWCLPYEDWPDELKEEYSYNPDKARQMLADAGFPNGFKTHMISSSTSDTQLLQVIQSQFKEVGVDFDIEVMDHSAYSSVVTAGSFEGMCWESVGYTQPPNVVIHMRSSTPVAVNAVFNNDPVYDAIAAEFMSTGDPTRLKQLNVDADRRCIEQHWSAVLFPLKSYTFWQPYLKGYSGEGIFWGSQHTLSRLWIDQEVKASMGR